jgi:GH25 family lysozyme M1 (1,4-beta-N-acetylmuramidase)
VTIIPPPPIAGDIVIDVSHWESIIDWPRVKAAGIKKAIIKLTDGVQLGDPLAGYNARRGRDVGVEVGFYHFLRPALDAVAQIETFAAALYGVHWELIEPTCLDVEASGGLLPSRLRTHILSSYKRCLSSLQVIPEIYTRATFWRSCVGVINWTALLLPEPHLWAADYGYDGRGSGIKEPRWLASTGWKTWRRWQYTDKGIVPGISGACDLNVEQQ